MVKHSKAVFLYDFCGKCWQRITPIVPGMILLNGWSPSHHHLKHRESSLSMLGEQLSFNQRADPSNWGTRCKASIRFDPYAELHSDSFGLADLDHNRLFLTRGSSFFFTLPHQLTNYPSSTISILGPHILLG